MFEVSLLTTALLFGGMVLYLGDAGNEYFERRAKLFFRITRHKR